MLVALALTVQAHRRSAELAQMQTDFVAHVSHQLKTPLSLLSAATETLQMDRIRSPEKLAEYLDTIRAEASRLSSLVQRVLEFSRLQQQRTYEFEQVDLGALVRETVDAFAHSLSSQHVTFDVRHERPGPFVLADPAALEQVVANLLDNAVKYSRRRSGDHRARARRAAARRSSRSPTAALASPPADQGRIFERFYRAPGAPHRPASAWACRSSASSCMRNAGGSTCRARRARAARSASRCRCITEPATEDGAGAAAEVAS